MGMNSDSDDLGDRMKAYEAVETARTLDPALPIYARIDGTPESEPLFRGKIHKLTSILASMAAASFQHELRQAFQPSDAAKLSAALPHFDARVFASE